MTRREVLETITMIHHHLTTAHSILNRISQDAERLSRSMNVKHEAAPLPGQGSEAEHAQ